jgi:hypothetical protein
MPCSNDLILQYDNVTAYIAQQSEVISMTHNMSDRAEVRIVQDGLAILIPRSESIPSNLTFTASTLGVRTSARFITDSTTWQLSGPEQQYWDFYYTEYFRGILGKQPGTVIEPLTADQSILTYKPTDRLLFGFYMDSLLQLPYNSQGADMINGSMPMFPAPMPDEQLINPVYFGVAYRASGSERSPAGNYIVNSSDFYRGLDDLGYWYGFTLSCAFEIFEVEYTWHNGTLLDIDAKSMQGVAGGKVAEIFHGSHWPSQPSSIDVNLQDLMVQATQENDAEAVIQRWSELYSTQVMSVVGAFMIPARSLIEQEYETILVAQVAIPPLILVVVGALAYAIFGICVVSFA